MKMIGIMTCGTYYSPWIPYGIVSFYFVDEIVIVNGGYRIRNFSPEEYNIPLEQVTRDISNLDIQGKIVEIKDWSMKDLRHKVTLATEKNHPEKDWVDMRGLGLTLATEKAWERGADWVLKWDSDQVGYKNAMGVKNLGMSVYLHQYEFVGDMHHLAEPPPHSPYNDSVFTYPASQNDWYTGGGGPVIRNFRVPSPNHNCAHLRNATPVGLSEEERFKYFFERQWFHTRTNSGLEGKELEEVARGAAQHMMTQTGKKSDVPPPEVTLMSPAEYIQEVILKK